MLVYYYYNDENCQTQYNAMFLSKYFTYEYDIDVTCPSSTSVTSSTKYLVVEDYATDSSCVGTALRSTARKTETCIESYQNRYSDSLATEYLKYYVSGNIIMAYYFADSECTNSTSSGGAYVNSCSNDYKYTISNTICGEGVDCIQYYDAAGCSNMIGVEQWPATEEQCVDITTDKYESSEMECRADGQFKYLRYGVSSCNGVDEVVYRKVLYPAEYANGKCIKLDHWYVKVNCYSERASLEAVAFDSRISLIAVMILVVLLVL